MCVLGGSSIILGPCVLKKAIQPVALVQRHWSLLALVQYMNMSFSLTKWHNHVHAWKTSSSKGSLLRDQSVMVDCDQRLFRVHIAACRAGRPRSGSLAQRNPPPTNRYCPHRHHQQQHPGWTEGGKEGPEEEERTERRDETGLFHLEKGVCVEAEEERWR